MKRLIGFCLLLALFVGLVACRGSSGAGGANAGGAADPAGSTSGGGAGTSGEDEAAKNFDPTQPTPFKPDIETNTNIEVLDYQLPNDVPLYPGATITNKRKTNRVYGVSFTTTDAKPSVVEFYNNELKRRGWKPVVQMPNSTDGELYSKGEQLVRVIAIDMRSSRGFTEVHLFITDPAPVEEAKAEQVKAEAGEGMSRDYIGNIAEAFKFTDLKELPQYPNSERDFLLGEGSKGGKYRTFKSKDSVEKIAKWYAEQLPKAGWSKYHDTSEAGDSMIIYSRKLESGDVQYVGVRVNDKQDHRKLTLVSYPINATVPKLKTTEQLIAENPEAAKEIEKQMAGRATKKVEDNEVDQTVKMIEERQRRMQEMAKTLPPEQRRIMEERIKILEESKKQLLQQGKGEKK